MSARTWLAWAVVVVLTAQVGLVMTGVYLDGHRVDGGSSLDSSSYMDNAGAGLGWLAGSVLAPVFALALVAVASGLRRTAGSVLALTLVVVVCGVGGGDVPVLGILQGAATCAAVGVCLWLTRASDSRDPAPVRATEVGTAPGR